MGTLFKRAAAAAAVLALAGTAAVVGLSGWIGGSPEPATATPAQAAPANEVARGAYLATVGNCAGCHTARGGAAMAGGRAIATPFGTAYAGNLTPDAETGLGSWTANDFWRALHHGRSRDGRFLLPAFPYPQYTQVSRADADALWAWLRSLPAVRQSNRPHDLRFPYGTQAAQAVWRALYFRPETFSAQAGRSAEWNRGAYLVNGLAHCAACHAPRNLLGATRDAQALSGGQMPLQGWYAPALNSAQEGGLAQWPQTEVMALLREGRTEHATVLGPMAEVVLGSTQFLNDADVRAITVYLQELPQQTVGQPAFDAAPEAFISRGRQLYEDHCADCHGPSGAGAAGAYPPLAGNRALTLGNPANIVRVVLAGGFAPATAGNPRPYGMPPFAQSLSDEEVAAVVSYVRWTFGGQSAPVSPLDVQRLR